MRAFFVLGSATASSARVGLLAAPGAQVELAVRYVAADQERESTQNKSVDLRIAYLPLFGHTDILPKKRGPLEKPGPVVDVQT